MSISADEGRNATWSYVGLALPAILAGIAIIGIWQLLVMAFQIESFILPAPTAIIAALSEKWQEILSASVVTVEAVVLGLVLGSVTGLVTALLVNRFRSVAVPLVTAAVIVNCAPIVALAPIFNNWFGVTNIMSKAAVAAVMVFFPMFVNVSRGLTAVAPIQLEFMDTVAASARQVLIMVRLPNSLPYIFTALRLGATLAVIGVIVTEYFGGPRNALGIYIAYQAALPRLAEAWAGIVAACLLGLVLYGVVALVERFVMPWHKAMHADSE